MTGSADLYKDEGRDPLASINFITAHDGFTLRRPRLLRPEAQRGEPRGRNSDGTDDNRSWNRGAEGPTDDPAILELRARQQRNFLATLLLSQGTPMLLGGDEMGRSQHGNNNAWCQDNEISWYDWDDAERESELLEFTRRLIRLRRDHPVLRRERFLLGEEQKGSGLPDVWWFRADGRRMTRRDWQDGAGVLGMFLNGAEITTPGPRGEDIEDDSFLLLFNGHGEDCVFTLPEPALRHELGARAVHRRPGRAARQRAAGGPRPSVPLVARSLVVLKRAS